jgi:hypothetical protein
LQQRLVASAASPDDSTYLADQKGTPIADRTVERPAQPAGRRQACAVGRTTIADIEIGRLFNRERNGSGNRIRQRQIAEAVLWLGSDASSFVVGHSVAVAGLLMGDSPRISRAG